MRVCVCVCVIDNIPIYIWVFRCVWSCLVFSSSRCYEHGTFVPRLPSIRLKRSSLEQLHCHTRSQWPSQTISTQSIWREGAADVIRKFLVLCPEPCSHDTCSRAELQGFLRKIQGIPRLSTVSAICLPWKRCLKTNNRSQAGQTVQKKGSHCQSFARIARRATHSVDLGSHTLLDNGHGPLRGTLRTVMDHPHPTQLRCHLWTWHWQQWWLALSWHWPPFLYPETDGSHSLFRPGDALSNGTIELQRIPMRWIPHSESCCCFYPECTLTSCPSHLPSWGAMPLYW